MLRSYLSAWLFMWTLSFAIFFGLKWITWWQAPDSGSLTARRSLAYLAAWPGMDAETFLDSRKLIAAPGYREWLWATLKTVFGALLLWLVARRIPEQQPLVRAGSGFSAWFYFCISAASTR